MLDMPRLYHYRSRRDSDMRGIRKRMAAIPDERKHEVSIEYERIFGDGTYESRREANRYLDNEARKYTVEAQPVNRVQQAIQAKTEAMKVKQNTQPVRQPPKKGGYLDSLFDEVDKSRRKQK